MQLRELLKGVSVHSSAIDLSTDVTGVSYDSRTTKPGDVFVAVTGYDTDGHKYIPAAAEKGALCAVCEHEVDGIPCIVVDDSRRALALMGANWFDHPACELTMVGITGTSGKTTTTYLVKSILEKKAGAKVGLIGTIHNMIGDQEIHTDRTTPESFEVQQLLRQMADAGCSHCVMEVSSHALMLHRVEGIRFAVGVYTNLSQDHLDFHNTMEEYCDAKSLLFDISDCAVYNMDDAYHQRLLQRAKCRKFSFGLDDKADLKAKNVSVTEKGVAYDGEADVEWAHITSCIPGNFTVYNTLGAVAACYNLGVSIEDCADALAKTPGVKGRMEIIPTPGKHYTILNDYSHKPDALEKVLHSVKGFAPGRTVVLFGCGGDRDRTKRPLMGKIAAQCADFVIVTSDNPRTEDPQAIMDDILPGMEGFTDYVAIADRVEAIHWAMDNAQPGDVIVLAGKGHEDYQEINHQKFPMDERVIVADYLK